MYWLRRPPYLRWFGAALILLIGLLMDLRGPELETYPFAAEPIPAGSAVDGAIELKLGFTYAIESLMKKDSLELTDDDRTIISGAVAKESTNRILITHGTDTMVQTAKKLANIQGKTIVLTGALKPALFKTTDAVFNIGCAVIAVQTLGPGIYIAMNGCVFTHDRVRKNVKQGIFETL